jgi:hypothetical protein
MCEYGQLAFNYFVHNAFDPTADDYTHKLGRTQELERQPDMAGDYICPECYGGGPVATLQGDQCPKCQTEGMQYFDVGEDGGGGEEPGGAGAQGLLKPPPRATTRCRRATTAWRSCRRFSSAWTKSTPKAAR